MHTYDVRRSAGSVVAGQSQADARAQGGLVEGDNDKAGDFAISHDAVCKIHEHCTPHVCVKCPSDDPFVAGLHLKQLVKVIVQADVGLGMCSRIQPWDGVQVLCRICHSHVFKRLLCQDIVVDAGATPQDPFA